MNQVNLFCSICNQPQAFDITIDDNKEWLATCSICGHVLKYSTEADLAAQVIAHNEENKVATLVDESGSVILTDQQKAQLEAAQAATSTEIPASDSPASDAPAAPDQPATEDLASNPPQAPDAPADQVVPDAPVDQPQP